MYVKTPRDGTVTLLTHDGTYRTHLSTAHIDEEGNGVYALSLSWNGRDSWPEDLPAKDRFRVYYVIFTYDGQTMQGPVQKRTATTITVEVD